LCNGLATPAAIAVGLGRAAKNGILFRNATSLENFKDIVQAVFDKTGTLTTGQFVITNFSNTQGEEDELKNIAFSMEKYSNHPIANSISLAWKSKKEVRWKKIEEVKGMGMHAWDEEGNEFWAGSYRTVNDPSIEDGHNVYITRNNKTIGWIDVEDEVGRRQRCN
jgi:Cu+-exporting ATPase